ncbi:phospholipase D-like domain-containing protein [Spirosoma pulveris]
MNIEFLPEDVRHRDVTPQLIRSLTSCYSVEGSIAFWTLGVDALSGKLLQALSRAGSAVYVDMQWPTNFGKLAQYVEKLNKTRATPVFYICLRKHQGDARNEVVSLLHTKILLFNLGDRQWEIWIGSHNFTEQALRGRNLEGSIRITGKADEPQFGTLIKQVRAYLDYIRNLCEPFDPNKIIFYEVLRGDIDKEGLKERFARELAARIAVEEILISRVLSLRSENAHDLSDQTIIILGNLFDELSIIRQRNRGGSPVFLRVKDSKTGAIFTYEGRMRAFDNIDNFPSSNVSFNQRRWAVRTVSYKGEKITPPLLKPAQDVGQNLIETNRYYVNVEIVRLIEEEFIGYYTYPETDTKKLWRPQREPRTPVDFDPLTYARKSVGPVAPVSLVPVEDAEELASIRPINWTKDFIDGILERRVIVIGRNKR